MDKRNEKMHGGSLACVLIGLIGWSVLAFSPQRASGGPLDCKRSSPNRSVTSAVTTDKDHGALLIFT